MALGIRIWDECDALDEFDLVARLSSVSYGGRDPGASVDATRSPARDWGSQLSPVLVSFLLSVLQELFFCNWHMLFENTELLRLNFISLSESISSRDAGGSERERSG